MRLLAIAHNANDYDLIQDDIPIATVRLRVGGSGRAQLAGGAGTLLLHREDPFGARYTITREASASAEPADPLLRATHSNPLLRLYAVTIGNRQLTLRARSPWRGDYELSEGASSAGVIIPAGRSRNASATFPDDLPQEAAIALFCLVLAIWRFGRARVDTL